MRILRGWDRRPAWLGVLLFAGPLHAASWQCANDIEVSCGSDACLAVADDFTPMQVNFDDTGALSVCAYSGCWEGVAAIGGDERFLSLVARDLPFSTSPDHLRARGDLGIMLDRDDAIAVLKVGGFAHPLRCTATATAAVAAPAAAAAPAAGTAETTGGNGEPPAD